MPKWKETTTYAGFAFAVAGMILQSKIGDAGYVIPGLAVALFLQSMFWISRKTVMPYVPQSF